MIGPWKAILHQYPAVCRPITAPEPLGNAGGLSGAELWRIATARGPLVVRRWPVDGPTREEIERIHAWLFRTADLGIVPVPIRSLDGRTVLAADGRLWELAPWMPGNADLARPPSTARLRTMFAGLATFHQRLSFDRSEGPSPGLIARALELDRLLDGEMVAIRSAIDQVPTDPRASLARLWIDRLVVLAPRFVAPFRRAASRALRMQPGLRDARPDHFLFEGDRLTGLVDFGAMGRDTVAGDLARLLGEGVGPDRAARAEALASYEAIHPLGEADLAAIQFFENANALLGAGRWARWHFLDRRVFTDPEAVARGLKRGLARLEEWERGN